MLPKEILQKIRRIEIQTRNLVNDVFSGEYHSVFRGRGMEFSEVREYQPGDSIRTIDWNVTARTGHPFVKKYVEERELTVILMVDASSSGEFGTCRKTKREISAEISALLAFSAIKNNDRVGLIIFTDQVEKFVPPKKGSKHVLRVIRELLYFRPRGRGTDIAAALDYLNRLTRRKAVVFLISDFLCSGYERALRVTNKRHDLVAISITDPREQTLPNVGFVELEDAETGERILRDTADRSFRQSFTESNARLNRERARQFAAMNVDAVNISLDMTEDPYLLPLMQFFKMRAKKFR
jgi:uncharacterized protein (DUF58 family)